MRTKLDVQLELFHELDTICMQNDLKYILFGLNSLDAYINDQMSDSSISVAMTHGDIERFCNIVLEDYSDKRYVEGTFNNPDYIPFNVSYGNENTTDFNMVSFNKNIHKGIQIIIYPIEKHINLDGTPITNPKMLSNERKLRNILKKRIVNDDFWYLKMGLDVLNKAYSVIGGGTHYYNQLKKATFIDKWEDIQNFAYVKVDNKKINARILKEISRFKCRSLEFNLPKNADLYFSEIYGPDFSEIEIKHGIEEKHDIVDTELGYEYVIANTEDILKETRSTHESIIWERRKVQSEKESISKVWNLVKMTQKQIEFTDYFNENLDNLLSFDLDDEKQLQEVSNEISPVINILRKYSEQGMTFSINEEADGLIHDVLIRQNEVNLAEKIREISKKEYFIE